MVDPKARPRKKVYNFDVRRKYEYVSSFRTIERPPIERIKDMIKKITNPPKKAVAVKPTDVKPQGGFNFAVFGAALLIAVIILGVGFMFLTASLNQNIPGVFKEAAEKPAIDNLILNGEILSSGERNNPLYAAGVQVDYNAENVENYSITLTPYEQRIPSEVFILNSQRIEASTYTDFVRVLRSNLEKRKILLNEITIDELESLPQGATVIIPSGVIPKEILGYDSLLNMRNIVDRGIVIIYMGQPFNRVLNGSLVVSIPAEDLQRLPVQFDQATVLVPANISLFQPLYRATASGNWESKLLYGSISAVSRGDGAFIFVPQTLDGGWRGNPTNAANDISKLIFETPWADAIAQPYTYNLTNGTFTGEEYFFTNNFGNDRSTVKVEFIGHSDTTPVPVRQTLYTYVEKIDNNEMYIDGGVKVVPTSITTQPVRINAILKEDTAAQPEMFLRIVDSSGEEVDNVPQGPVNVQADRSFDVPIDLDEGEYIISLVDDFNNVHAQSYMKIVSIDVEWKGNAQGKPYVYVFDVTIDGNPITLSDVTVSVDGGQYGSYRFNDVSTVRVDLGSRTENQRLPYGNHNFKFTSGALTVDVPVVLNAPETIFSNPILWVTVLLTAGIVGIGILFARREEIFYSIDIPNFPPVARTRVPLGSDIILGVISKVNDNYKWEKTPLTTAEIKNGFKDVFYQGKPIYITDFNVEFILDQLVKKKKVVESNGYYGLQAWEGKHSMDYLALMRWLRDICVNNAVPFTGLDESKEADSVITVVGQQMYLHFYDKEGDHEKTLKRALKTIGSGITIMVFKNENEKQEFITRLNSSTSVAPIILKMESDSKSMVYHTPEELEQMVKDFKSM